MLSLLRFRVAAILRPLIFETCVIWVATQFYCGWTYVTQWISKGYLNATFYIIERVEVAAAGRWQKKKQPGWRERGWGADTLWTRIKTKARKRQTDKKREPFVPSFYMMNFGDDGTDNSVPGTPALLTAKPISSTLPQYGSAWLLCHYHKLVTRTSNASERSGTSVCQCLPIPSHCPLVPSPRVK